VILLGLLALAVSVWCSYVGLVSHPSVGVAGIGGICVVASLWLIVEALKGRL
jgi:hypothetical protein